MGYRGKKSGYYAQARFESHVCGIVTRAELKRFGWVLGLISLVLVAVLPDTAEAGDYEPAVALTFNFRFGQEIKEPELQLGVFVQRSDSLELNGMGLLELRMTPARGVYYALLDSQTGPEVAPVGAP
jgi:hypothetical protein